MELQRAVDSGALLPVIKVFSFQKGLYTHFSQLSSRHELAQVERVGHEMQRIGFACRTEAGYQCCLSALGGEGAAGVQRVGRIVHVALKHHVVGDGEAIPRRAVGQCGEEVKVMRAEFHPAPSLALPKVGDTLHRAAHPEVEGRGERYGTPRQLQPFYGAVYRNGGAEGLGGVEACELLGYPARLLGKEHGVGIADGHVGIAVDVDAPVAVAQGAQVAVEA